MKGYIQAGDQLPYVNATGATIISGAAVLVGKRIGVAVGDIPDVSTGVLVMKGVVALPKLSTDAIGQGDILFWDDTNKCLTLTATNNTQAGYAFAAAGAGTSTVNINLNR